MCKVNWKKILFILTVFALTPIMLFAENSQYDGLHNGKGNHKNGKMKQIMEKYRGNAEFEAMMNEIKVLRTQMKSERKALKESGQKPDKETVRARREAFRTKMDAIKAKYQSKFPDFFEAMDQMKQNGMKKWKQKGSGSCNCPQCNCPAEKKK